MATLCIKNYWHWARFVELCKNVTEVVHFLDYVLNYMAP